MADGYSIKAKEYTHADKAGEHKTKTMDSTYVATIGFFDGVHRGHRYLIGNVIDAARHEGRPSMVITFDRHPRLVLHKEYRPRLLTTAEEKRRRLEATGIDLCVMLHFDERTAALSAHDFMRDVLRDSLNVGKLIIGYDNRFGHNRAEGFDDYVRYGRELGIEVVRADAFRLNGVQVSSSVIRSFLSAGETEMAAMCLGYHYTLAGTVVQGYHEGRKIGFPTANIKPSDQLKLVPEHGVYAVKVRLDSSPIQLDGMMNIGTRPTFDGTATTLETNIFDFSGDIYGHDIEVAFYRRLREERKFASVSKLAEQLKLDREEAMKILEEVRR